MKNEVDALENNASVTEWLETASANEERGQQTVRLDAKLVAENARQTNSQQRTLEKILSIDAGRKYLSKVLLKQIIAKASLLGYTGIELILGNDGLRFLLEDMSVAVAGNKYSSEAVKAALLQGNRTYYDDPNGNALTQAELDEILQYATEKKLQLIPVINSPGHMDAILEAMKQLKIPKPEFKTSKRTIDLEHELAVAFTKALISKYVVYFSEKVTYFNFGCDEYANDVTEGGGWLAIQQSGTYKKFIAYANELAEIAKAHGLKPMLFNDGLYYNNDETFGTFNQEFVVAYWTAGWNGYAVASPELLVRTGHQILNTNDGWYWVIGRKKSSDGYYNFEQALAGIDKLDFSTISGATSDLPIIGSMQGIWADEPNHELVLSDLVELMTAYSERYFQ